MEGNMTVLADLVALLLMIVGIFIGLAVAVWLFVAIGLGKTSGGAEQPVSTAAPAE